MSRIRLEISIPDKPCATGVQMYVDGVHIERVAEITPVGEVPPIEIHKEREALGDRWWCEFEGEVRYEEYNCGVPLVNPLRTAVIENMRGIEDA